MEIKNVVKALEKHPTKTWGQRQLHVIREVILHQAASKGATAEAVNRYHITPTKDRDGDGVVEAWERNHITPTGCPRICYHFVIEKDGTVKQCNELTDVTWHAKGHNIVALGVLVAGYFKGPGHPNAEEPSEAQISSLKELLAYLHIQFPKIKKTSYLGHSEVDPVNKAACPGYTIMKVLESWRSNENS